VLASVGEDDFGQPTRTARTFTMAEARAAGWDLPEAIAAINAGLAAEIEAKRDEVEALRSEIEAKEAALQAATAGRDAGPAERID
jgi:hypothetical protein